MYEITLDKKKDLFEYFFKQCVRWMNIDSPHNQTTHNANTVFYYSLDKGLFLKRSQYNTNPTYNWVIIDHNRYEYNYLMHTLNIRNNHELTLNGRLIDGTYVKDDYYKRFCVFVIKTFTKFFDANVINPRKEPIKDDGVTGTPKSLF